MPAHKLLNTTQVTVNLTCSFTKQSLAYQQQPSASLLLCPAGLMHYLYSKCC